MQWRNGYSRLFGVLQAESVMAHPTAAQLKQQAAVCSLVYKQQLVQ